MHPSAICTSCATWLFANQQAAVADPGGPAAAGSSDVDRRETRGSDSRATPPSAKGNVIFQSPRSARSRRPQIRGEATRLVIGNSNQIASSRRSTSELPAGGGTTRIGNGCLLMANSHVAHDVQIADGCILANSVALAGHVDVETT